MGTTQLLAMRISREASVLLPSSISQRSAVPRLVSATSAQTATTREIWRLTGRSQSISRSRLDMMSWISPNYPAGPNLLSGQTKWPSWSGKWFGLQPSFAGEGLKTEKN